MELLKNLFKGDKVVWAVFLLLCLTSVLEVFSASSTLAFQTGNYTSQIIRHTGFLVGGAALAIGVQFIPLRVFKLAPLLLLFTWICLILMQCGLGVEKNDGIRWFKIFGVPFQPSELAKMGLIITVAIILSHFQEEKGSSRTAFKWILGCTIPTLLLIAPDNLSTALILGGIIFLMMFIGRVPFRQLGALLGIIVLAGGLFATFLLVTPTDTLKKVPLLERRGPTWKNRLLDFSDKHQETVPPEKYDIQANYQVGHAHVAIASGNVIGLGSGNSKTRDNLPQAYSDFIFAIILEELGILPAAGIIFLYVILLIRTAKIANKCNRDFPALMAIGVALLIVMQAFVNMMVAVGLFPVTGQPLPLISRGGTSTLINCVYIGIILSVSRYNNIQADKQQALAEGDIAKAERLEELGSGLDTEPRQGGLL